MLPTNSHSVKPFSNDLSFEASDRIGDREFNTIREIIFREAGISLSDAKRTLVCSRLAKRLRHLRLRDHVEYLEYLEKRDPRGIERQVMINCLTTNKTDFFREPHHFEFLRDQVFPQIEQAALHGGQRRIRIWSAACSTGEEPYTIAMTLLEHFQSLRTWDVEILATDINTEVVQKAKEGVYSLERIEGMDQVIKQKYFLKGTGKNDGLCQVASDVRRLVKFRQLNFMDRHWGIEQSFDVIFCRNVLIYFNTQTQQQLLPRLVNKMVEGGYLLLGHSENLPWLTELLAPLGHTIHQLGNRSNRMAINQPAPLKVDSSMVNKPQLQSKREIKAGEVFASKESIEIATTLGSCVAVCLFDPVAQIGGMNHFMLPSQLSNPSSARYGSHAIELLIDEIVRLGGNRTRLMAKVFGGASVMNFTGKAWNVGKSNAEFVRSFLNAENIPIVAERLEGTDSLRVHFLTADGTAYVRVIPAKK